MASATIDCRRTNGVALAVTTPRKRESPGLPDLKTTSCLPVAIWSMPIVVKSNPPRGLENTE
jgi:hypothetical protein